MKFTRNSLLALCLGGIATPAIADDGFAWPTLRDETAQSGAKGFLEGGHLDGTTRNFAAYERSARGPLFSYHQDGTRQPTHSRRTLTQGTILDYRSGFTEGQVGLAVQLAGYHEMALERNHKRIARGGNRTLTDSDGDAIGQWSKLGLANLRLRASNTTLSVGRQSISTPMVDVIGNRALPSSFQGVSLISDEWSNLTFQGGTFDRASPRTEQSLARFTAEYGDRSVTSDRLSTLGFDYQPLDSLSTRVYASRLEDIWDQFHLGLNHHMGDNERIGLDTSFSYYRTKDSGSARLDSIDNHTWSLGLTASHKAHSVTLAWQQVDGNEYFDYAHETNGIHLANSLLSDYNGPNEKSVQIGYNLDMASYGVPGLRLGIYKARGWNIDGTHYKGNGYDVRNLRGETHYEHGLTGSYVVQEGTLKNTSFRAFYIAHRASANQGDGSLSELRLVTTIPFNLL